MTWQALELSLAQRIESCDNLNVVDDPKRYSRDCRKLVMVAMPCPGVLKSNEAHCVPVIAIASLMIWARLLGSI